LSRGRWRHHAVLAMISLAVTGSMELFDPGAALLDKISLASAYLCLAFMTAALSIGPWRAVRAIAITKNIYLRRDIGVWASLTGLVHLFVATELSMSQQYMKRFVNISTAALSDAMRADLFSWGSIIGFLVGVFVLILLVLSNDRILRIIGPKWWKRLQRLAYPAFALTVLHGFAFQALEARPAIAVGIVLMAFIGVLALQISGFSAIRKRGSG
jgi:sulfoxide reductase heme-binding subunit YedZ